MTNSLPSSNSSKPYQSWEKFRMWKAADPLLMNIFFQLKLSIWLKNIPHLPKRFFDKGNSIIISVIKRMV